MKDLFTITDHIPIEFTAKDIDSETGDPYDDSNDNHVSEWAIAVALGTYKIGETTTLEEFKKRALNAKIQQSFDRLWDLGLVEAVWDEKTNTVGYRAKIRNEI